MSEVPKELVDVFEDPEVIAARKRLSGALNAGTLSAEEVSEEEVERWALRGEEAWLRIFQGLKSEMIGLRGDLREMGEQFRKMRDEIKEDRFFEEE
jgi:hypothetical protein